MKNIIAAIALLATTLPALALDPRTQDYRKWSAEQEINHLIALGVQSTHPTLQTIREAAADGDDYLWAVVVEDVHKLQDDVRKIEARK